MLGLGARIGFTLEATDIFTEGLAIPCLKLVHRGEKRRDVIKLLDFGLATLASSRDTRLTRYGVLVGTPDYLAPEIARGAVRVSPGAGNSETDIDEFINTLRITVGRLQGMTALAV